MAEMEAPSGACSGVVDMAYGYGVKGRKQSMDGSVGVGRVVVVPGAKKLGGSCSVVRGANRSEDVTAVVMQGDRISRARNLGRNPVMLCRGHIKN